MSKYKADNGKIIETNRMDLVISTDFDGQYGYVHQYVFRAPKSHNWYLITESSWSGEGSISRAESLPLEDAAKRVVLELIADKDDLVEKYPELEPYIGEVLDV